MVRAPDISQNSKAGTIYYSSIVRGNAETWHLDTSERRAIGCAMKTAILIFFVLAVLVAALSWYSSEREKFNSPDDYASAFGYLAAIALGVVAFLLTAVYALFRLFTG